MGERRVPLGRIFFYVGTVIAVLIAFRGVFFDPLPFWFAFLCVLAYAGLVVSAVLLLPMRVFVDAIVEGPSGSRGVALTFDDGPDPQTTRKVLETLDGAGAKATFFVIGRKAEQNADLVREILARGHDVGLHSYEHDRLFSLRTEGRVRADLERGIKALTDITGTRPTLFRPPVGHTNPILARVIEELDLMVVGWSVSGRDGTARATAVGAALRVKKGLKDGAIVLLHDAAELGTHAPVGPEALTDVLREIQNLQLTVVPLSTWIDKELAPAAAPSATP